MGLTEDGARRHAEARERREQARQMADAGLTVDEIARRLSRSRWTVMNYLHTGPPQLRDDPEARVITWEEKAHLLAAAYPNEERRQWILRQMGIAEEEG